MKTVNTSMYRFIRYIDDKNVYIYGVGDTYQSLMKREPYKLIHHRVAGYIDNGKAGQEIHVFGKSHPVYKQDFLKTVGQGVVLLCGVKYISEMYRALCTLNLPDSVECFILPLIWAVSDGQDNEDIKKRINDENCCEGQIEKKIHCFWFSGDKKPQKYQMCIDSWKRVCPDYEIMEWNAQNYDYEKNMFVKQAFEKHKWAFVSDYARLDVIYHYGGIYLDMDVELFKRFDPFLKFKAFFNFGTQFDIDLGSGFGSVKENPFLERLLELYRDKEFVDKDGMPMVWKYAQPAFIRDSFKHAGVQMNGDMQLVDDMLFLPRKYYTPMDDFFLQNFVQCEETRGIHQYNAGWCTEEFHQQRKEHLPWIEIAKRMI